MKAPHRSTVENEVVKGNIEDTEEKINDQGVAMGDCEEGNS
jgi:hypothetical protein